MDERLTTVTASQRLHEREKRQEQRGLIDAAAAVAILEQALAFEHSGGKPPGELVSALAARSPTGRTCLAAQGRRAVQTRGRAASVTSMLDPEVKPSPAHEIVHKGKGCLAVLVAAAVLVFGGYFV